MNRKYILILLFLVLTPISQAIAQQNQIGGFWEVETVQVGDRDVTPVAKWFQINEDGTYQAGNGWMQNDEGTWAYDEQNQTYAPTSKNGLIDEFGAFSLQFELSLIHI